MIQVPKMIQIEQVPAYVVWPVRHEVMYPDKDFETVKLKEDDNGIHLALFDGNELISVVSLFKAGDALQFRKFATRQPYQGQGYGSALLNYVIEFAKNESVLMLWCNARVDALPFYKRFGFEETGTTFCKGEIDYNILELKISSKIL